MPVMDPVAIDDNEIFIQRIRAVSSGIDEYVSSREYLLEADTPDQIDQTFIRRCVVSRLLLELENLGLHIGWADEDIHSSTDRILLAVTLRDLFDEDRFRVTLQALPEEQRTIVRDILEQTDDIGELVRSIAEYLYSCRPTDLAWENLDLHREIIWSDEEFRQHLLAIYETAQEVPLPSPVSAANLSDVATFTDYINLHRKRVKTAHMILAKNIPTLDQATMLAEIRTHDKDLFRPEHLVSVAQYYALKLTKTEALEIAMPPYMHVHKSTVGHHKLDRTPDRLETSLAMLISDEYVPGKTKEQYQDDIKEFGELTGPEYEFLMKCVNYLVTASVSLAEIAAVEVD